VFISGSPRTGTTWVLEVIERMTGARRHWEPEKGFLTANARRYGTCADPGYTPSPDASAPEGRALQDFLLGVLDNACPRAAWRAFDPGRSLRDNVRTIAGGTRTIVKFVKVQRYLPWIISNSHARGVVILRDPLSTVASMARHAPPGYIPRPRPTSLASSVLDELPEARRYAGRDLERIERLAVMACADIHVARTAVSPNLRTAHYEDLLDRPGAFSALVEFLGMDVPHRDDVSEIRRPSTTTRKDSGVRLGTDPRMGWKSILSPAEVDTVHRVMADFRIDRRRASGPADEESHQTRRRVRQRG
jgi:hypothetical protein